MKAIIPVAGAGTKLRPHTNTQPKALIPIAGKTVLSIIIEQLLAAGVNEYILVVGYLGDKIQNYVEEHYPHLKFNFVQQNDRLGLGHAIFLSREFVGNEQLLIVLGDTICELDFHQFLAQSGSFLGVKKVDDPRSFGVAEINEEGIITRLVEKPQIPKSNMALVGLYKIDQTDKLFQCLEKNITIAEQNEKECNLTDALDCMIEAGVVFHSYKVQNWFDCGRKDTLLESNAILLKKLGASVSNKNVFENTIILPPVSIAEGCEIKNSIIGPNVAIGEAAQINYSIVKNSIIGSFAKLYDVVLHDSLIGNDSEIKGETRTLNIGDNTEIDLG